MNSVSRSITWTYMVCCALVALLFGVGSTFAATFRFLGVNDQNWGNGFSWESASAPPADGGDGTSDVLVRGAGGTARLQDFGNNDIDWHIRSLTFESQATRAITKSGSLTFWLMFSNSPITGASVARHSEGWHVSSRRSLCM